MQPLAEDTEEFFRMGFRLIHFEGRNYLTVETTQTKGVWNWSSVVVCQTYPSSVGYTEPQDSK